MLVKNGDPGPCILQTHIEADGYFRFDALPTGEYWLALNALPQGYDLQSMTAGDIDLFWTSLKVAPLGASIPSQIRIEVARRDDISHGLPRAGSRLQTDCLMHQVWPHYPLEAAVAAAGGSVILSIGVDAAGFVHDVDVVAGDSALTPVAVEAVQQWRYAPAVFLGKTIPVWKTVVISFATQ